MKRLRVAAMIEAYTVTGPAKNLLRFGREASEWIDLQIVSYVRGPETEQNAFLRAVNEAGLNWHVVREAGAYDRSVPAALRKLLEQIQPDLVQTHSVKSHFLFRLAVGTKRYPWVAFHHGYTAENLKVKFYNQLDRWSLSGAGRVVTVCGAFADELRGKGVAGERIDVIPNAIGTWKASGQQLPVPGVGPDTVVLLHVGRFSGEKNHAGLLRAAERVAEDDQSLDFQLVLVGDGLEREAIAAKAAQGALAGRVWLAGQQRDVRPFYERADVFALPSWSEGSPNVVLEAMAAGLPVLATRVGGTPDLVSDGQTGYLVEAGDEDALVERLRQLIRNRDLRERMAAAGREKVKEFSVQRHREQLLGVYRKAYGRDFA